MDEAESMTDGIATVLSAIRSAKHCLELDVNQHQYPLYKDALGELRQAESIMNRAYGLALNPEIAYPSAETLAIEEEASKAYHEARVVEWGKRKPTAAEIAAKFGIKTGATIEEVEPFVESGLPAELGGSLGPDAGREPVLGASEKQTSAEIIETGKRTLFIQEFGRQAWDRAIRIPNFKKAKWDQRFEMAREQKERGE